MPRHLLAPTTALLLVIGCAAATSGSAAVRTERLGTAPRTPAGAKVLGALPGGTSLKVTVALAPRDPVGLAAYAAGVSDPASPDYRQYLSVSQFAQRFGADPSAITDVRSSLRAHGLGPGAVSPNGLSVTVDATASRLGQAFSTLFRRLTLRDGRPTYANASAPELDAKIAGDVQAIVGLDDLASPQPLDLQRARAISHGGTTAHAVEHASSAVTPCTTAASAAAAPDNGGAHTIDQIASAYDFNGLYAAGDEGAGTTVAVYELEGNFPADITAYQSCFGTDASVSYDPVDGGGGRPNANNEDGLETELDIENLIGLAPKVNVVVYQGPNTAQGGLATYEAIISADTAKVIQTSWGECEPDLGNATARAEATVFAEAAVQGQTVVAAAGDSGAQDCYGDATAQDTATTVDDPASQPFVTGVGGTTLSSTSPRSETVWNDGAASLVTGGGAGGGGDSSFWTMPGYQSSAPSSLGVINSQSSSSDCPASGTYCREVPDVSADAAIDTGYLVYWDGNGENSDSNAWISVAGTSAAAPVWAALFALADEESTCSTPIGFANPGLYSAAASNYAGDFYDVTSGNNDLLGASGSYTASTGYDQASGLGTPIASTLAPALCSRTLLTLTNPGAQKTGVGNATSLQLKASESGVTYAASGLPPGLALSASTGLISGRPTTAATYTVKVTAVDHANRAASTQFTWTVEASKLTLATPAAQTGQVKHAARLRLRASDSLGSAVTYKVSGLPSGLTLSSAAGLISGTPRKAGRYTVRVAASASNATAASTTFTWTIGARPSLTHALIGGAAKRRAIVAFRVSEGTDGEPVQTISLKLPSGLSFARHGAALTRLIAVRNASGSELRFTTSLSGGRLKLTLSSAATVARVQISPPALGMSATLAREAAAKRRPRVTVKVTVGDAGRFSNTLRAEVTLS